jgi:hypothetical protein
MGLRYVCATVLHQADNLSLHRPEWDKLDLIESDSHLRFHMEASPIQRGRAFGGTATTAKLNWVH